MWRRTMRMKMRGKKVEKRERVYEVLMKIVGSKNSSSFVDGKSRSEERKREGRKEKVEGSSKSK